MVFFHTSALVLLLLMSGTSLAAKVDGQWNARAGEMGKNGRQFLVVLEPKKKTVISAEVMSPVVYVNKKMGDSVHEGELILKLDDTIYHANLQKTEANLSKAAVELDITRRLFEDKSASLFDLKSAEAQLAQANSEYWQAKKLYESTFVRAPYNGKVVKVHLDEYELSQPGKELVEVVDDSKLYARFLAPSTALAELRDGSSLVMNIDGVPKEIRANITRISPIIEAISGTIKVEAEIDNAEDGLIAGMVGQIGFNTATKVDEIKETERPEESYSPARTVPPITRPQRASSDKGIAL